MRKYKFVFLGIAAFIVIVQCAVFFSTAHSAEAATGVNPLDIPCPKDCKTDQPCKACPLPGQVCRAIKRVVGEETKIVNVCKSPAAWPAGFPATQPFPSPVGATSFSAVMCAVITFFSNTILPPIAVLMMLVVGFLFMVGGQVPQKAIAARKTLLYVVAGVLLLMLAPGILAIVADITGSSIVGPCPSIPMTMDSIVKTIANLINWFAWFVSITSVAMGLYAGALYLTARGDSSQVLKATKVFSYTIIGIAVSVVAFSIIILTKTFFGI